MASGYHGIDGMRRAMLQASPTNCCGIRPRLAIHQLKLTAGVRLGVNLLGRRVVLLVGDAGQDQGKDPCPIGCAQKPRMHWRT